MWLGLVLAAASSAPAGTGVVAGAVSPPVAQAATAAVTPAPSPVDAAATAQKQMRAITDGVGRIRRLMPLAENRAVRVTCVMQKLVEAKIHVQLAEQEMAQLEPQQQPPTAMASADKRTPEPSPRRAASAGDRAYALTRLDLIAKRTVELETAARICVEDDLSSIDITEVHVEKKK
jgi:hypothetical protein